MHELPLILCDIVTKPQVLCQNYYFKYFATTILIKAFHLVCNVRMTDKIAKYSLFYTNSRNFIKALPIRNINSRYIIKKLERGITN